MNDDDKNEEIKAIRRIKNCEITPELAELVRLLFIRYLENGQDNFTLYIPNSERKRQDVLNIYDELERGLNSVARSERRISAAIFGIVDNNRQYHYELIDDPRTRVKTIERLFDKIYKKVADKIRNLYPQIKDLIDINICNSYPQEAFSFLEEVLYDINDPLRYTIILPNDEYVDGLNLFIKIMQNKGYALLKYKNKWLRDDSCKGIFLVFEQETKEQGYAGIISSRFEVQVHTKQNYAFKEKSRLAYDIYRNPRVNEEYRFLADRMRHYYHGSLVEIPEGILEWSYPVKRRDKKQEKRRG